MPWKRKWQPTPVFLPGESHGQRSLPGYRIHRVAKSQTQWVTHSFTFINKSVTQQVMKNKNLKSKFGRFYDPMDCSPPGLSVHGILQARILEWVAIPSSRGSSQPRDWTQVSHIAGGFFTIWATKEIQESWSGYHVPSPGHLPNPGFKPGSPAFCIVGRFFISWATREAPIEAKIFSRYSTEEM